MGHDPGSRRGTHFERGGPHNPDILYNGGGGGVIVSYFEMVQNESSIQWDEKEVEMRLEKR